MKVTNSLTWKTLRLKTEFKFHSPPAKCPVHKQELRLQNYLDKMSTKENKEYQKIVNEVDDVLGILDGTL